MYPIILTDMGTQLAARKINATNVIISFSCDASLLIPKKINNIKQVFEINCAKFSCP